MASTSGDFGGPNAPIQCTAMSKRTGERCKGPAIADSPTQKCRMHGGYSSVIGRANSQFKHGRYSKYLPAQLDDLYNEALTNEDLLNMSDHIALLEAKIQETLSESSDGDPAPLWSEVGDLFATVESEFAKGDADKTRKAINTMRRALDAGQRWDATWGKVTTLMEQLRKMTDTEVKRKKELNQFVPVERVILLMTAVSDAVKRNVKDPYEIERVRHEISLLMGDSTPLGVPKASPDYVDLAPETRGISGGTPASTQKVLRKRAKVNAAAKS